MFDTVSDTMIELALERDSVVYTPPEEEVAKWRAIGGEQFWEKWVTDREAEGFTEARDILDDTLEMIEGYQ